MRIHHLQHVPFEGLGSIEPELNKKGHQLTATHLYKNQKLPIIDDFDTLIVMGGPMNIYDYAAYPWLSAEKVFIKEAIAAGKIVLGICLGAQLIANVLGAKIYPNQHREIGWFTIQRSPELEQTILSNVIPKQAMVFHWHGDTFDIPNGAKALAESAACKNQGFILDDRVVGFQFHLETTEQSAKAIIENCRNELDASEYVQSEIEMLSKPQRFIDINQIMLSVLNALEANSPVSI